MTDPSQLIHYSELIEYQAKIQGRKPYILHEDQTVSFADFNRQTCRMANGLYDQGAVAGDGLGILMANCVEYCFLFYGLPKGGLYSVPINTALKGEGLKYILNHSDIKYLAVDEDLYSKISELGTEVKRIEKIFVRRTTDAELPPNTQDFMELFQASPEKPMCQIDPDAIKYLMYTSGTTGFPKGVVNRNRSDNVQVQ